MKKYRIFSNYYSSTILKNDFEKIYNLNNDPNYNKKFSLVDDNTYTHAIILNTAMPKLNINKTNVIGFSHEPIQFLQLTPQFIEYAKKNIKTYYIGEKLNLPLPFKENFGFLNRLPLLTYIPEKKNIMSLMVSEKNSAPGHKYRHKLVQAILKTDLPIDIWGAGTKFYNKSGDTRIKTSFTWDEYGIVMLEPYKFHIAIENFTTPHYLSEKILNCFICNTMPIYWGCRNIDNYVPKENIIFLSKEEDIDKRINEDILLLQKIIENPDKYYKPVELTKIDKLLNFFDFLDKAFI